MPGIVFKTVVRVNKPGKTLETMKMLKLFFCDNQRSIQIRINIFRGGFAKLFIETSGKIGGNIVAQHV